MTRKLLLILCAVLMLSPHAESGKRYALIVGVNTYRPGQPLPELPYTENDATELAATLKAGGYQVTLMTQTVGHEKGKEVLAPLSDYIRDQIDALLDNPFLKDDDVVIVAFAGHGVQYEFVKDDAKTPHFYFCPADADIRKIKTANEITERNRLIDLTELYDSLRKCKAGGKLLLVDACRNDPTKPGITRALASNTLPPLPPPPGGTAAFFSCSAHQKAFEDKDLKHGVFFHHVIQALKGDADTSTAKRPADGKITLAELSQFVSVETYDFVRTKFQGAKQAPELKGEFRLVVPLVELRVPAGGDSITNSIGMKLELIPAGTFMMGSRSPAKDVAEKYKKYGAKESYYTDEHPRHRVTLSKPFYMGRHEVTRGQFAAFVRDQNYRTDPERDGEGGYGWNEDEGKFEGRDPKYNWKNTGFTQSDEHPVVNVTWNDAVAFCEWLSGKEGRIYRLPSEAEWEYACRGGTTTDFFNGDNPEELALVGNVADATAKRKHSDWIWTISADDGHVFTAPAGRYRANGFGLYDLHGNVDEWCQDWYGEYSATAQTDPRGPSSGSSRVLRGGSWSHPTGNIRSAGRRSDTPGGRYYNIGFRVVCESE